MPGLGTSFGRGGASTFMMDLQHSDSILIMGSNMAECHPVAFRWVMKAKTRDINPCTVMHTDPRAHAMTAGIDRHAVRDMFTPFGQGVTASSPMIPLYYWRTPVTLRFGTNPTGIRATSFSDWTSTTDTSFVTGLAT